MLSIPFVRLNELLDGCNAINKLDEAINFLETLFANTDELPQREIEAQSKSRNIAKRTLDEAKKKLHISSVKIGSQWFWRRN